MEIRYSGIGENISQIDSYVTCDAIEVQHLGEISEKWGTLGDQEMVYSSSTKNVKEFYCIVV